ncbi:hypothetical protein ACKLNR_008802 [Fusarium oxysporum f. sp. zingiberi]
MPGSTGYRHQTRSNSTTAKDKYFLQPVVLRLKQRPEQSSYRVLLPFKRSQYHILHSMRLADSPESLINVPKKDMIVASDLAPSATPSIDLGSLSSGKICDAGLPAHHLLTSFGCMASQLAAASRSHQATLLTG